YLPPRPQAELLLVYRAADVFVLPSTQREGFPLVIQEALVCGLRVITCPDPGYEPYRRLPGLSFCERRPEALRAAILAALAGPPPADDGALDDLCPSLEVWLQRLYASADGEPAGPVPAPVATRA